MLTINKFIELIEIYGWDSRPQDLHAWEESQQLELFKVIVELDDMAEYVADELLNETLSSDKLINDIYDNFCEAWAIVVNSNAMAFMNDCERESM